MIAGLPQAPSEYNPLLNPEGGATAPKRGPARDGAAGIHLAGRLRPGLPGAARPRPGPQVRHDPRALLLRLRPAAADRQVRGQHGPKRRAQGLHDDQPEPSGRCPASGRLVRGLLLGWGPAVGARLDRRDQRPHPRDGLLAAVLADLPVQLRGGRSSSAGVLVQALRPGDRDSPGDEPRLDLLLGRQPDDPDPPRRDDLDRQQLRASRGGDPERARGHDRVGERRVRSARPRRRPGERTKDGVRDGDHHPSRRHPGRGDRRSAPRRDAARAGGRLRDARRRRSPPHGHGDRQGRVPERRHRHAG